MTNEELALSLYSIFKPFGLVTSVKASRDHRGRPFGFIEFATGDAANSALQYAPQLSLDGRRIRVEGARRQRKLCVKVPLGEHQTVELALEKLRLALVQRVAEEDFKLTVQSALQPTANDVIETAPLTETFVAAIVKFEDCAKAKEAIDAWRSAHPDWSLTWINLDRTSLGSNIRNSGLVQLVPAADGSLYLPRPISPPPLSQSIFSSPTWPTLFNSQMMLSGMASPFRYPANYEDVTYESVIEGDNGSGCGGGGGGDGAEGIEEDDQCKTDPKSILKYTLFVGRLNSQAITLEQLHARFVLHGSISFIRLYNRALVGLDGVPVDAYAFIRYRQLESVRLAVQNEHGKVWLGQAIKCEPARSAALGMLQSRLEPASAPISPPLSPAPINIYYGQFVPANVSYDLPHSGMVSPSRRPNGNWFRAKNPPEPEQAPII